MIIMCCTGGDGIPTAGINTHFSPPQELGLQLFHRIVYSLFLLRIYYFYTCKVEVISFLSDE